MEYFSVYGTALSMWVTLMGESRDASPEGRCIRKETAGMPLGPTNWFGRGREGREGGEKRGEKKVKQDAAGQVSTSRLNTMTAFFSSNC